MADQRRFAAPDHHQFSTFGHGGPALKTNWPHPTLKLGSAVERQFGRVHISPHCRYNPAAFDHSWRGVLADGRVDADSECSQTLW